MKQWEEPESTRAMNGRACLDMVAEVSEIRNELGDRDVEFSRRVGTVLPFIRQPSESTWSSRLPFSFPNLCCWVSWCSLGFWFIPWLLLGDPQHALPVLS